MNLETQLKRESLLEQMRGLDDQEAEFLAEWVLVAGRHSSLGVAVRQKILASLWPIDEASFVDDTVPTTPDDRPDRQPEADQRR